MQKTQKQLEEHTLEIEANLRKKKKPIKENEEEVFFIEESTCFNEHYNFYNNLITVEKKHTENGSIQKLKKICKKKRIGNERKRGRRNIIHGKIFVF